MNRFLKPKQLDDDQRSVIADALSRLNLGDAEGRRIFVYALDYELTEYVNYLGKQPQIDEESAPVKPLKLEELLGLLKQLSENLQNLTDHEATALLDCLTENDLYRRQYAKDYIGALIAELVRVQIACNDALQQQTQKPVPSTERPEGEFVRMLANAYIECFEQPPQPSKSGSFAQILKLVGEQIGLDLNFDETALKRLIASSS